MPGVTAKVFRTYNAYITLDEMVRCNLGFAFFTPQYVSSNINTYALCQKKSVHGAMGCLDTCLIETLDH